MPASRQPPRNPRQARVVGPGILGVEDEDHPADAVAAGRVEQCLHELVDLVGASGEVDPGMETVLGLERQHHHRVARREADHDRHHREQVLGVAGHQ